MRSSQALWVWNQAERVRDKVSECILSLLGFNIKNHDFYGVLKLYYSKQDFLVSFSLLFSCLVRV